MVWLRVKILRKYFVQRAVLPAHTGVVNYATEERELK
jgi:hypothetical protein